MDIALIQNAESFIEDVKRAFEYAGEYGIGTDPYRYIINDFRQSAVDSYLSDHADEFYYIIDFANLWDVDITEYELDTLEQKFEFCANYISYEISIDNEYKIQEAV